MAFTTEEQALRSALDEVTVGQPEAPVDRAGAVRRRHVRRRQLQSVAAMAAVAVVAAGAVVIGGNVGGSRHTQELNRPVPSWALAWADHRDGSVPQQVLAGAVSTWAGQQRAKAPLPDSQPIDMPPAVWYVGQRVPGTDQVLAVFEATGLHAGALGLTKGTRLVVATAAWDDVKDSTAKGSSKWNIVDVAAPPHGYAGFIGSYFPVATDEDVHNIVWLLTSPSYRSAHTPGRHELHDGFTTFDAGVLSIRVEVSMEDAKGRYPVGGYVGIPGAPSSQVPRLAPPGPLTGVPQGLLTLGQSSSQGSSVYVDANTNGGIGLPTTIYARCYTAGAGRSIRVSIDPGGDPDIAHGVRIPCDDRQHVVPGNPTGTNDYNVGRHAGHAVAVQASDLTAWAVAVVMHAH